MMVGAYLDTSGSSFELKIFNWIVFTKNLLLNKVTFTGLDIRCFWAWGTRPFSSLWPRGKAVGTADLWPLLPGSDLLAGMASLAKAAQK